MDRSRWAVLTPLSLVTVCVLRAYPAEGAPGAKVSFVPSTTGPARPASPGKQLWVKRYNGQGNFGNGPELGSALGVSSDGSTVFVTGASYGTTSYDYATLAQDASTGKLRWVRRYNGPGNGDDLATSLGVSPDGSKVFVTGRSVGSTTFDDYATVAYDAFTGTQLWGTRYNGPKSKDDIATTLGVSPDGSTVFVTGRSIGPTGDFDYATMAYDASTGSRMWLRRYDGPAGSHDLANSLGMSSDGSKVFVTGSSLGPTSSYDYATVAYDASTGAGLWVRRYDGPAGSYDLATSLEASPDASSVFVTGQSVGPTSSYDYATVAYDAPNGALLWVRRYNGPANDVAFALEVSPDSAKVFVSGYIYGGSTSLDDYATVAYDASTGKRLWVRRYNGPASSYDIATSIGVSPDGSKLFVAGYSRGTLSSYDYATVAYEASSGALLWVRRYNGPGNDDDSPTALGVSPDGSKVIVTGVSTGLGTNSDYATIAYSTT